jgi:hypothetical protein
VEPIEWGFSFAPWICAWITSLCIAALVLGIGHFTRYRPGLVWIFTSIFLLLAIVTFEIAIGFDELDYQLYVAKNNPEHVSEFDDHSIAEALNETTKDPVIKKYLEDFFYPADQIARRQELKREIEIGVSYNRWPSWFIVPQEAPRAVRLVYKPEIQKSSDANSALLQGASERVQPGCQDAQRKRSIAF